MSNANVTLIQSLYAAFGRGDIATIVGAMSPDIVWTLHGQPGDHPAFGVFNTPQGVQKFFGIIGDTQTASDFSPKEFYVVDDKVFVLGHYAWTMKKTGRSMASDWVHIFTVKGGKVAKFDEFNDTAQFAAALR